MDATTRSNEMNAHQTSPESDTDLATRVGTAIGKNWRNFDIGSCPAAPTEQSCRTFRAYYPVGHDITDAAWAAFRAAYTVATRG